MYDPANMTLRELLLALQETMTAVDTLDDDEQAECYGAARTELRALVTKLNVIDALA
jgi:hypothetical protein